MSGRNKERRKDKSTNGLGFAEALYWWNLFSDDTGPEGNVRAHLCTHGTGTDKM